LWQPGKYGPQGPYRGHSFITPDKESEKYTIWVGRLGLL
jgi:hypothetical protein